MSHVTGAPSLGATIVMLLAVACGGRTEPNNPPPPPPPPSSVVATVEVIPVTSTLAPGDSVQLVATAKTASGAVVSNATVTWTSSAPNVATVSAGGKLAAVAPGNATITAAADGKTGTAAIIVALVVIDNTASRSAIIDRTGGVISASASSGVGYQLTVPAGAVDSATRITLSPVTGFGPLRLSGGLAGAVDLQPSGLRFRRPATLTIRNAAATPGNLRLAGFSWVGNGDSVRLQPAQRVGSDVEILITHFSGAGAGFGTVLELATLPPPPNSSALDSAFIALAGLTLPADRAAIEAALRKWQLAILARLGAVLSDVQARDAVLEAEAWLLTLASYPGPEGAQLRVALAIERGTVRSLMAAALRNGIAFANQQCLQQKSLVAARNVVVLHLTAQLDSLDVPGSGLTRLEVKTGLCVQPVVTDSLFDQNPPVDSLRIWKLRFSVRFGTTPASFDSVRFRLQADIHGTRFDRAFNDTTDARGNFPLTLVAAPGDSMFVNATSCVDVTVLIIADHCVGFRMVRFQGGRTINGNVTVLTQLQLDSLRDVSKIVGTLAIVGTQSTDLRELSRLREVTGLLNLNMPQLQSLQGLRGLQKVGGLVLRSLAVSTLDDLSNLQVGIGGPQLFVVTDMPFLQSLINGPKFAPGWKGSIGVERNAILSDLGNLFGVTEAGSVVIRGNPKLPNVNGLLDLQRTSASVAIGGAGLTQISFQSLRDVGGTFQILFDTTAVLALVNAPVLRTAHDVFLSQGSSTPCGRPGSPTVVQLPALDSVSAGFVVEVARADCPLTVSAPALRKIGPRPDGASFLKITGAGVRSVVLGDITIRQTQATGFVGDGIFDVVSTTNLTSITFGKLDIQGGIRFSSNVALTALSGPDGLRATQGIEVNANAALQSISGMSGSTLGSSLFIFDNPSLTSLTAWIGSTVGSVFVTRNQNLSTQAVQLWATQLSVAGSVTISQNKVP